MMNNEQGSMINEQWTLNKEQRSMLNDQGTTIDEQWTMSNE